MEQITIENRVRSPYPFYGVGIFSLVYALIFDLYRWLDYGILLLLSVILYFVLNQYVFHEQIIKQSIDISEADDNTMYLAVKNEAKEQMGKLKKYNDIILDNNISQDLDKIVNVINKILEYLASHPSQSSSMRKILSYYLPTLLDLLKTYTTYGGLNDLSQDMKVSLGKIEEIVETMSIALQKKYEDLYQNEIIDANADISVLKAMLSQDGLLTHETKEERI